MQARGTEFDLFGKPIVRRASAAQMALPLKWRHGFVARHGDFLVGESNAHAAQHVQDFANWYSPASIVVGPPKSGKSLLATLFSQAGAGEIIDGLTDTPEADVFHAWNRAVADSRKLLIIANSTADLDQVRLPDLRTRLSTAPVVHIAEPDYDLAVALVDRLLAQRGLAVTATIPRYMVDRIDRSYASIHGCVDGIDRESMASGRPLGVRLVRDVLGAMGITIDPDNGSDVNGVGAEDAL